MDQDQGDGSAILDRALANATSTPTGKDLEGLGIEHVHCLSPLDGGEEREIYGHK